MTKSQTALDLEAAHRAVAYATEVREFHARTSQKGSKQREDDLAIAQERLAEAMKPLRRFLGRAPYGVQTRAHEITTDLVRDASAALQGARRRLWKMSTTRQEST